MDLVRDLLDKAVIDRQEREIGRADTIVLEVSPGQPPRVTAIDVSPSVLANRIHPFFGRLVAGIEHVLRVDAGRPLRIPFDEAIDVSDAIKVSRIWSETPAATLEQRLRRWIAGIPGSS